MTKRSDPSALASFAFKTGVWPMLILGLTGCEGLGRFALKPDNPVPLPPAAEQIASTPRAVADEQRLKEPDRPLKGPLYEWKGAGQPITRIVINTDEQKARFYSGDTEIGWSTVATGVPKYPTPIGQFRVTEKIENKRSNLYGKIYGQGGRVIRANAKMGRDPIPEGARFEGAHMPFYLRLTGDGIGLHAGPIPKPGRPASHGCIRMPVQIAPVVFRNVAMGTPVIIEGKGPTYSEYLAQQRAEQARLAAAQAKPQAAATRPPEGPQANPVAAGTNPVEAEVGAPGPSQPTAPPAAGPELAASAQPAAQAQPAEAAATPTPQASPQPPATASPQAAAASSQGPSDTTPAPAPSASNPPPAGPGPEGPQSPPTPPKPAEAAPGSATQGQGPQVPAQPQQPAGPAAPKPQETAPAQPTAPPAPAPAAQPAAPA